MLVNILNQIQEFGQNNSTIEIAIKSGLLYLSIFWIALTIWVAKDSINRSNNILFHVFSILLNIFLPVFWLILYLLIRPTRTLMDKYYEDLEFQALSQNEKEFCPKCHTTIEKDYKFCGECGESLLEKCTSCKKEYSKKYKNCPFCWEKKEAKSKNVKK